jgi:hypothetical protein
MWNVIFVPQEQLQCVCARFEGDFRLGLAGSEMQMIEVVGNGLIERRQLGVDQQVMMTGIRAIGAGWCDPHLSQAKADSHLWWNGLAVLEIDEVNRRPFRRGRWAAISSVLCKSDTACPVYD